MDRRLTYAGTQAIDFNRFPLGCIDHIDILKDGAHQFTAPKLWLGWSTCFYDSPLPGFGGLPRSYGNTNLGSPMIVVKKPATCSQVLATDKTNIVVIRPGIYNRLGHLLALMSNHFALDADYKSFGAGPTPAAGNFPWRITTREFSWGRAATVPSLLLAV